MPDDAQFNNQPGDFETLEPEQKPPSNQLGKNQKLAVAGLVIFAFLIVILWSVQLKNNIYAPFNSKTVDSDYLGQVNDQTANDLALKNKDTDSDGLSDYDELNFYKTSPYLEDSDSDGIKDGEEIKKGTDPNCAQGRTCSGGGTVGADAAASPSVPPAVGNDTLNKILNQSNAANPTAQPGANSGTANLTNEQIQILKGMDVASLRQILLESGMAQEDLDKISDAELMQSFNEMLAQ